MAIKEFVSKFGGWWNGRGSGRTSYGHVDDGGLLCDDIKNVGADGIEDGSGDGEKIGEVMVVKKAGSTAIERQDSIDKMGEAFNLLVEQLGGINEHLGKQVRQHEDLMSRIDQLPELLETLPDSVNMQRQVVESLTEQLKIKALKDQQFAEVVGKIPAETIKQTHALVEMNQKFSVSTDINSQMSDNFNRFGSTLEKLDVSTSSQSESIAQMGKTFAASDRYLKYIISKQNKRFMWVFIVSLAISVLSIATLIVIVAIIFNR